MKPQPSEEHPSEDPSPDSLPGQGWLGTALLFLSVAALPLVWLALRRLGRWGGLLTAAGCGVLFARDATMVRAGALTRLRPLARSLLLLELVTSAMATLAVLWVSVKPTARRPAAEKEHATGANPTARLATVAAAATFALHAVREAIYLRPSHGRTDSC